MAATLLFVTRMPAAQAAQVSFVAALAVADLADTFVGSALVALKWPNDTLVGGAKASGILVESGAAPGGGLWLAVGCGVNLALAPETADRPATAFARHMDGPPPAPDQALAVLDASFARWRAVWESDGFSPIAQAWTARAYGLGQACEARLAGETIVGVAESLGPDGALRLRLADGTVRGVTAGDVFF